MYLIARLFIVVFVTVLAIRVVPSVTAATDTHDSPLIKRVWQSTEQRDHPLVGTMWDANGNQISSIKTIFKALERADFVLVGETHDNPDHHEFQARILDAVVKQGRKPAVVWEMFRLSEQYKLDSYNGTSRALGKAMSWDKKGWPDWSMYEPIARIALANKLPMLAGDADRPTIRKLATAGFEQYPQQMRNALFLSKPLPPRTMASLNTELKRSHCNMMPDSAIPMMANVQRLRDAQMARVMVDAFQRRAQPVFLVAGSGHTRTDRGIPFSLRLMQPGAKIVSVAMVETRADAASVTDIASTTPEGSLAADFVIVTPAAQRADQCEELRKQFERRRKKKDPDSQ